MALKDAIPSVLLENVVSLIHTHIPKSLAPHVESFAHGLYGNMAKDDLYARTDSDLYGAALSLWNALNVTASGEVHLRVLNPSQAKDGWQSTHSIIEIIHPDMPFLVDSVGMALNRLGITAHMVLHKPFAIGRDTCRVSALWPVNEAPLDAEKVAVFAIEIDRQSSREEIRALEQEIQSVLADVAAAVNDWQAMSDTLQNTIDELPSRPYPGDMQEFEESVNFLSYLKNHHFTLLGYRRYDLKKCKVIWSWCQICHLDWD